jgi:hypothetical protein
MFLASPLVATPYWTEPTVTTPPVFVLGCPRSGTTLLAEFLTPTKYGAPVETHFITKYAKLQSAYGDLSVRVNFDRLVADILAERPVMQWKLHVDQDALWAARGGQSYADIVHGICLLRARGLGKSSWGDKTPHYILDLPRLDALFPHAKFVVIVRDGRDVALSLLEKTWGPGNLYACAQYWKACHAETPALARLRARGRVCEVSYEALLDDPRAVVARVYAFLEEPFPEAALRPLLDSVRPGNRDKWQARLTPAEIRLFEHVAAGTLARFGYASTHQERGVGVVSRAWFRLHAKLHTLAHLVRTNTVDALRIRYLGMEPFAD